MLTLEHYVSIIQAVLGSERVPTEEEVRAAVDSYCHGADDDMRERVRKVVEHKRRIRFEVGIAVKDDGFTPWLDTRRSAIRWHYWSRFRQLLLNSGRSLSVVRTVDRDSDSILELLGDPGAPGSWSRRGLVMGSVQSGKTQAYTSLIAKASDAGYKVIILLTGTLESLRRQTQERIDEGFVGFDSGQALGQARRNVSVGVGIIDGAHMPATFTSTEHDFKPSVMQNLGITLAALRVPAVVVVKKHTGILEHLYNWLHNINTQGGAPIDEPVLVIDDEADNASVNTNVPESDPTGVNRRIRALLTLFSRNTYVGFTATPFANVFIDPEPDETVWNGRPLGQDLFPRDFIYTLNAPSDYFGPSEIFLSEHGPGRHVRDIRDDEAWLPARHRAGASVSGLPDSLLAAIDAFLITNAIRDLRGEGTSHRSMLVNVSGFTRVQNQVEALVHQALDERQVAIRNYCGLPEEQACQNDGVARLRKIWGEEFAGAGFSWSEVQRALPDAVGNIKSAAVNQSTGSRSLDFRAHKETGLRVIAVGGNSLSRGLTLEGLTVSYFRRRTVMYDALLQMGRWFGYRPGYEDLCRLWLVPDVQDWYADVTQATFELRAEFRRMYELGRRPIDFGLAVRQSPYALLITARNKMRTAEEIVSAVKISEASFESVELPLEPRLLESNQLAVMSFLEEALRLGIAAADEGKGLIRTHVPRSGIVRLLQAFAVPGSDLRFSPDALARHLAACPDDVLSEWDVAVPSGSGTEESFGPITVKAQVRAVAVDIAGAEVPQGRIVISGNARRVASRGAEAAGLTAAQCDAARALANKDPDCAGVDPVRRANMSDLYYRRVRERPLLLVHVVATKAKNDSEPLPSTVPSRVVAIHLSFPTMPDHLAGQTVKYKANVVHIRTQLRALRDVLDPTMDGDGDLEPVVVEN